MGLQLRLRAETGASYKQAPTENQRVPDVSICENDRAPALLIPADSSIIFHCSLLDFLIDEMSDPQTMTWNFIQGVPKTQNLNMPAGTKKQKDFSRVQLATEFVLICCKNRSAIGVKV